MNDPFVVGCFCTEPGWCGLDQLVPVRQTDMCVVGQLSRPTASANYAVPPSWSCQIAKLHRNTHTGKHSPTQNASLWRVVSMVVPTLQFGKITDTITRSSPSSVTKEKIAVNPEPWVVATFHKWINKGNVPSHDHWSTNHPAH